MNRYCLTFTGRDRSGFPIRCGTDLKKVGCMACGLFVFPEFLGMHKRDYCRSSGEKENEHTKLRGIDEHKKI